MGKKFNGGPGKPVGRSERRTPAKHALLNAILGEEVSAARYVAPKLGVQATRIVLLDATAGDGSGAIGKPWHSSCSPGLFAHHARFARTGAPVWLILNEIQPETYSALLNNLHVQLPLMDYVALADDEWIHTLNRGVRIQVTLGDARQMVDPGWGPGDFGIVNNDPNTVLNWAMPLEPIIGAANARGAFVRAFNTMGCNAGGLKAWHGRDIRSRSFDNVASELEQIAITQDVILHAIERDDSQWAYLVTTPRAWVDRTVSRAEKVFANEGLSIESASYRRDPEQFDRMLDVLFLTKKERGLQ